MEGEGQQFGGKVVDHTVERLQGASLLGTRHHGYILQQRSVLDNGTQPFACLCTCVQIIVAHQKLLKRKVLTIRGGGGFNYI